MPVREAFEPPLRGARTHGWSATGDDPKTQTVIGVVEMDGNADAEQVIARLEKHGIVWLPNHHGTEKLKTFHVEHLGRHGVTTEHTTLEAMTKVHAVAGFPPLRPKRF